MAYHDDLLAHARQLVDVTPAKQVTLRRAVSAAYYAVFHLLIAEATSNWNHASLRTALGRAYDHGVMKTASNRIVSARDFPLASGDPIVADKLRFVAQTFVDLQDNRHFSDYNLTENLEPEEAITLVDSAERVFSVWPTIRTEEIAQAYLVSLLVKRV
jgi:uncharacterized protein (UPF0332 family)